MPTFYVKVFVLQFRVVMGCDLIIVVTVIKLHN